MGLFLDWDAWRELASVLADLGSPALESGFW